MPTGRYVTHAANGDMNGSMAEALHSHRMASREQDCADRRTYTLLSCVPFCLFQVFSAFIDGNVAGTHYQPMLQSIKVRQRNNSLPNEKRWKEGGKPLVSLLCVPGIH
jgi:hypothetical protein